MSTQTVCDGCGSKKVKDPRGFWTDEYNFAYRIGRRVVYLGVTVYQGKPDGYGRRMRRRVGRRRIDLCRSCMKKVIVQLADTFRKEK